MRIQNLFYSTIFFLFISSNLFSQVSIDSGYEKVEINLSTKHYVDQINQALERSKTSAFEIALPLGQNDFALFDATFSSIMNDEFSQAYPDIKTFQIVSKDNPNLKGRCLISNSGISYFINGKTGTVKLSPTFDGETHIIQRGKDPNEFQHGYCGTNIKHQVAKEIEMRGPQGSNGSFKRTIRLAIVCTGEYFQGNGGNATVVTNRIVENVNDIQSIFENDIAVVFELLTPAIYTTPGSDVFIPDTEGGAGRTVQAAEAVNVRFNANDYDMGHVFHRSTGTDGFSGGGVAGLGVICSEGQGGISGSGYNKAAGWSGSGNNTSLGWIELAAHEFGHMFDAPHTFNSNGGSCLDNISGTTAYEIGSGTSIMSYNGICNPQNIPIASGEGTYFHANSLDRMITYLEFVSCPAETDLGNTPPTADANPCGAVLKIPKNTPFFLEGESFDPDNDNLTYSWEQYDEDGNNTSTQGFIGTTASNSSSAPLFRSFFPNRSLRRYFPEFANIIEGVSDPYNVLPNIARDLNFRFVVRDNNIALGSGTSWDQVRVDVENSGPLVVSSPSGGESLMAGENTTIEWDPDGSEGICAVADIRLSLDGGFSFPYLLADDVNYGAGQVAIQLPAGIPNTETARLMVSCADFECAQFFNISNGDFEISSSCNSASSYLCDTSPQVFNQEAQELSDLEVPVSVGNRINSFAREISNGSPTMTAAVFAQSDNNCTEANNAAYEYVNMSVTETGQYTFFVDPNNGGGKGYITIYSKNNFDPGNPCSSFQGSTARIAGGGNNLNTQSSLQITLSQCEEYLIAFYNDSGLPASTLITSVEGPGFAVAETSEAEAEFDYTYVAVDVNTGLIDLVSDNGDFINLLPGNYRIYGAYFKSGGAGPPEAIDPQSWVGLSFSQIYLNASCAIFSNDFKPISIISSCVVGQDLLIGASVACDPTSNIYGQTFTIEYDRNPEVGFLVVNGEEFPITGSPQEVTIMPLADGQLTDVTVFFSEDANCVRVFNDVFTAPENCCPFDIALEDEINACIDDIVILEPGEGADNYQWFRDGEELTAETGSTLQITENGSYVLRATNNDGCLIVDSTNVVFRFKPYVDLGEEFREVCGGGAFRVTAISDASNFDWFVNDVPQDEVENRLRIFESGEYKVVVTNAFGCIAEDIVQVEALPVPDPEFEDFYFFCDGTSVPLDGGEGAVQYEWYLNNELIPDANEQIFDVTLDGGYLVIAESEDGCVGSATTNVQVLEVPVIEASDPITICEGMSGNVQVDVLEGAGDIRWFLDGEPIINATGFQVFVFEPGWYRVEVTNKFDCTAVDSVQVFSFETQVVDLPESFTTCADSETLEVELFQGFNYIWSFGGNVQDQGMNLNSFVATQNGVYEVEIESPDGCSSTDQVTITFDETTTIDLGPNITECGSGVLNIMPTIIPVTQGVEWELNGILVQAYGTNFVQNLSNLESGTLVATVDNQGCITKDSIELTIINEPTINFPPDTVACIGGDFELSVENADDFEIIWYLNGSAITGQTGTTLQVSQSGEYSIDLISGINCDYDAVTNVTFTEGPDLQVNQTSFEFCDGDSRLIEASSADGMIIRWEKDGEQVPGTSTNSLEVTESGIYTVVAGGIGDCDISRTIEVTVFPIPSFDLGEEIAVCEGESVTLTAGDESLSYVWRLDGTIISGENGNTIEVEDAGIYSASATSGLDCSFEDEVEVVFDAAPTVTITGPLSFCAGLSTTLTANSGLSSFQWQVDGMDIPNANGITLEVVEPGMYSVIVNPGSECSNSATVEVIISDNPDLDLGEDFTACESDNPVITAITNATSLTWFREGQQIIGENGLTYSPSESGFYEALADFGADCSTRVGITVKINPDPEVSLSATEIRFCPGQAELVELTTDATIINWFRDGEGLMPENLNALEISEPGTYRVEVATEDGCTAETSLEAIRDEGPEIDLGGDKAICSGETVLLDATTAEGTYQWFNNGNPIPFNNNPTFTATISGTYGVEVTIPGVECTGVDEVFIDIGDSPGITVAETVSICTGFSEVITAESAAESYQWFFEGEPIDGATGLSIEVDTEGTYTIQAANGPECSGTADIVVEATAPPSVDLGEDLAICDGQTVVLDAGIQTGNIEWYLDGELLLEGFQQIEASLPGDYEAIVFVGSSCNGADQITVEEALAPEIDLPTEASICEGIAIEITGTSTAGFYQWLLNDEPITGANDNVLEIQDAGVYTLEAFDDESCKSSASINVIPVSAPAVDLGEDIGCVDGPVELTSDFEGSIVDWYFNDMPLNESAGNYLATESGTYSLEVTAGGNCNGIDEIIVTLGGPPDVFAPEEVVFCAGNVALLEAESTAMNYTWFLNGEPIEGATESTYEAMEEGEYTVEAYDVINCSNTADISLTLTEAPIVDLGEDTNGCEDTGVLLDVGNIGNEYNWFLDGEPLEASGSSINATEGGTYSIEVSAGADCVGTDEVSVEIVSVPMIELPLETAFCEGGSFILSAGIDAATYEWYFEGDLQDEMGPDFNVLLPGTYELVAYDNEACPSNNMIIVNQISQPEVDLGPDVGLCGDDPVFLDAGNQGNTYIWTLDGELLAETGSVIEATQAGTYVVTVQAGDDCEAIDEVLVEGAAVPEIDISSAAVLCSGSSVDLIALGDAENFEWSFGTTTLQESSNVLTALDPGEYTLIAYNDINCPFTATIFVEEVEAAVVDLGEELVSGCSDQPLFLDAGNPGLSIEWYLNGELIEENSNTIEIDASGTYMAIANPGTQCETMDDVEVQLIDVPVLDASPNASICSGQDASISVGGEAANYEWYLDLELLQEGPSDEYSVTEAGNYTIIAYNSPECTTQINIDVEVIEQPEVELGEDQIVCSGTGFTLDAGTQGNSYEWYLNGELLPESGNVLVPESSGDYSVNVIVSEDCFAEDVISIDVVGTPALGTLDNVSLCDGVSGTLTIGSDASNFLWYQDGELLPGEVSASLTVTTGGVYTVEAFDSEDCKATAEATVLVGSVPEVSLPEDLTLCPGESTTFDVGEFAVVEWTDGTLSSEYTVVSNNPAEEMTQALAVTVINNEGCSNSDEIFITFLPILNPILSANLNGVCIGESAVLTVDGGSNYTWNNPDGSLDNTSSSTVVATPTNNSTYMVTVTDNCPGNESIETITIEVFDIETGISQDTCVFEGESISVSASGGMDYTWSPVGTIESGQGTQAITVKPNETTTYSVQILDQFGCGHIEMVEVCVKENPINEITFVNIITPNGDGKNDFLEFRGLEAYPENILRVYNRWGVQVYQRQRYQADEVLWDGTRNGFDLPPDTYYYILEFEGFTVKETLTIVRD